MDGGCRAGQVVDLIDFQLDGVCDIVPDKLKVRLILSICIGFSVR